MEVSDEVISYSAYGNHTKSNCVWHYFLRASDGKSGKCNLCSKILKIVDHSRKGLLSHLQRLHGIPSDIFRSGNESTSEAEAIKRSQSDLLQECVLCGHKLQSGAENDEEISYTFRLLDVDKVEEPVGLNQQEVLYNFLRIPADTLPTDYCEWNTLLCGKCLKRNNVICKFLNALEVIQSYLDSFRNEIEQQFRCTLENRDEYLVSEDDTGSVLRREIAKSFGIQKRITPNEDKLEKGSGSVGIIVPAESPSSTLLHDQSEELLKEIEVRLCSGMLNDVSLAQEDESQEAAMKETGNHMDKQHEKPSTSNKELPDPYVYFKKLFDLKRCHVSIPKLTNRELSALMNKSGLSEAYKCVFDDCPHDGNFLTAADRYQHIQTAHLEGVSQLDADTLVEALGSSSEDLNVPDNCQTQPKVDPKQLRRSSRSLNSSQQDRKVKRIRRSKDTCDVSDNPEGSSKLSKLNKLQCPIQTCKLFGKSVFHSSKHLQAHIQRSHEGVTHPFFCKECQRKFTKLWEYRTHIRSVHLGQYPYKCEYCAKGFINKTYFDVHQAKHTNEKNFPCNFCDMFFKTPGGVLMHKRYVHTGERPYQCETCGKSFVSNVKLSNHIKCVHNKSSRPFICHVCGKDFPIQGYLYMHMKNSHEGEKWPSKRTNAQQMQKHGPEQEAGSLCDEAQCFQTDGGTEERANIKTVKSVKARKKQDGDVSANSASAQIGAVPHSTTSALTKTEGTLSQIPTQMSTDASFLPDSDNSEVMPVPQDSAICNGATTVLVLDNVLENQAVDSVHFDTQQLVGIIDESATHYLHFLQR